MATVWRARDLQLERDVAIKIIAEALAADPRFVARFEREARLAAALNHPNLVKLFDYSVEDQRPFLVMEHVPGGTLAEARGQTSLDVDGLARELLDAVAHIHAAGIIHRDIKPANVLRGSDGSPRLTDFGIARGEETTRLTQTGQVLGTLRYIAPEVAAGEPATVKSDLYALGVLLDELHGTRTEALDRLLARLTARDPAERPASAAAAAGELERTRVLEPTREREPLDQGRGLTPTFGSRISRRHALAAAAVLVVLLVVVVVAAAGGGADGTRKTPPTAKTARPAPAGAPVDRQLDRLEQIVRGATRRR
jgi:serine/threonine-protein kinase